MSGRLTTIIVYPDIPFAEEDWTALRIGDVRFRLAEHCDRCATTVQIVLCRQNR